VTDGKIKADAGGDTEKNERSDLNCTMFPNCALFEHIPQESNDNCSRWEKNDPNNSHDQSMNQDDLTINSFRKGNGTI